MTSQLSLDLLSAIPTQRTCVCSGDGGPVEVYGYQDARGYLLYVGITGRPPEREREHAYRSAWMRYRSGDKLSFGVADNSTDATTREAHLIRSLRPIFNIQGNDGYRERRLAYLQLEDPDVLTTADGLTLQLDAELASMEEAGATAGPAMRFVIARYVANNEPAKRLLMLLAERQDSRGEFYGYASSQEMWRVHAGSRPAFDQDRRRLHEAGWIKGSGGTDRLPKGMEYDDDGCERFSFRIPTSSEDLADAARDAAPRGRSRR